MRLHRTLVVEKPLDPVFDFLSDFTTTVQWDPGTVTTVLLHGDGGIGTTYRNTTKFLGKETQLTLLKPTLERLGNKAEAGMRKALNRLEGEVIT